MKLTWIVLPLLLAGCATAVPVRQQFPDAPPVLMQSCPDLRTVPADSNTLRLLLTTVIENYTTYYQCANQNQAWQQWYLEQQKIFNRANK